MFSGVPSITIKMQLFMTGMVVKKTIAENMKVQMGSAIHASG